MKHELFDAQAQHKRTPDTFWVPSEDQLQAIASGNHVKLGFKLTAEERALNPRIDAERMWVCVTGPGIGVLANDPVCKGLKCGAQIEFEPRHVMDIL